jgi:hypothetical protein
MFFQRFDNRSCWYHPVVVVVGKNVRMSLCSGDARRSTRAISIFNKEVARVSVKTPLIANKAYSYLSEVYASRKINVNSLAETIKTLSPTDRAQIQALLQ